MEHSPAVLKAMKRFWRRYHEVRETCPEDIQCPSCGYYCLGKGGFDCIDKPTMVSTTQESKEP